MLTVFLDSISINARYNEKHELIEDLLSRDPSIFKICRTTCDIEQEKKNEYYYFNHIKLNLKEEWYIKTLFSNLPELYSASKYTQNVNIVRLLKSLAFRFRKLFYCINCIGIEHYFGNLKKNPIEPTV